MACFLEKLSPNLVFSLTNIQVITLSDLECDYLNARSCCEKLNFVSMIIFIPTIIPY